MSKTALPLSPATLRWLLITAAWIVLPLLWQGTWWCVVLAAGLLIWRWQVATGRVSLPSVYWRVVLLLGVCLSVLGTHHTLFGPEAGSQLVALLLLLKLLEMFRWRDTYVVMLLGYFVLALSFLFYRDPLMTAYVALGFVAWSAALIGVSQRTTQQHLRQQLRLAAVMFLQALPLLLISFVLVPRVAPLWSFSWSSEQARTGLSSSMTPGSITALSQSSDPVFRVTFDGDLPPASQRYWRGLTYSYFDGNTWQQTNQHSRAAESVYYGGPRPDWVSVLEQEKARRRETGVVAYRVLLEPTDKRWLFTLDVPFTKEADIGRTRDFRLVYRREVTQVLAYRVESLLSVAMEVDLAPPVRRQNLALPGKGNPLTREMAREWRQQSSSDEDYIQRVSRWFHQQAFYYTLTPDRLNGTDAIDDFLFSSRRGFCAHYASAFAVLMRAAGIPARIVAGYQGGTLNTLGDYLQVRQYDAHAWVEVWLAGKGWVRQDPTAAVSPARIDLGMLGSLQQQGDNQVLSRLQGLGRFALLQRLQTMSGYINYLWQRWVVSYDQRSQRALLANWWRGGVLWFYWLLGGVVATGLTFLLVGQWLQRQRRKQQSPWQRAFVQLKHRLCARGLAVAPGATPQQVVMAAKGRWPDKAKRLAQWLVIYNTLAYQPDSPDRARLIRRLRWITWRL